MKMSEVRRRRDERVLPLGHAPAELEMEQA
jgi:hypothetical protein